MTRLHASLLTSFTLAALAGCGSASNAEGDAPGAADAGATPDAQADATTDAGAEATPDASTDVSADGATCTGSRIFTDTTESDRKACKFQKGDTAQTTLALPSGIGHTLPIEHVIVIVNENRSFDHYLGRLPQAGKADVDGWPAGFSNKDDNGNVVTPHHLPAICLPTDPPHQWVDIHAEWNSGMLDGFVRNCAIAGTDGSFALGYYDETDIPFYYWMAKTWAMSDRFFGSVLSATWPNRQYLYAATTNGGKNTGDDNMAGVPTIFDAMDAAKVTWGVYANGTPRQDCLGWTITHPGKKGFLQLLSDLQNGTLPAVSFVDPAGDEDEHPPNAVSGGEEWSEQIYHAALASPLWSKLAVIYTWDEAGGLADHVAPPPACPPSPDQAEFDNLGFRVPLFVVSPYARPGYVSHRTAEIASITRFIETVNDLPALTARDANAWPLLDMFDFECPAMLTPPDAPNAGAAKCGAP